MNYCLKLGNIVNDCIAFQSATCVIAGQSGWSAFNTLNALVSLI